MSTVKNPLEPVWKKEEALYSRELSTSITKYLRGTSVRKMIDKALKTTNALDNLSPKSKEAKTALKIYRRETDAVLKSQAKRYPGMILNATIDWGRDGKSVAPSVAATASYMRYVAGGFKHKIKAGDTLRSMSTKYYGSELYWPVLRDANQVTWLEGYPAEIPVLECLVDHSCTKAKCRSGGTAKPAKMLYPEFKIDVGKEFKTISRLIPVPGMPVSLDVTFKAEGKLYVAKKGTLDFASFNPKNYASTAVGTIRDMKFKVTHSKKPGQKLSTVSIAAVGEKWSGAVALEEGNKLHVPVRTKVINAKLSGYTITGTLGFAITIKLVTDGKGMTAQEAFDLWAMQVYAIPIIIAVFAGAGVGVLEPVTAGGVINAPSSYELGYDAGYVA